MGVKKILLGISLILLQSKAFALNCSAVEDESTLTSCIQSVVPDQTNEIVITKSFSCSTCQFAISNFKNSGNIRIRGSNSSITLSRNLNPSGGAALFDIRNSNHISILNLNFVDNNIRSSGVTQYHFNVSHGSYDVLIDGLTIDTQETMIGSIGGVDSLRIQNSSFNNGKEMGIWMDLNAAKSNIVIYNNTFSNIGANAILTANVSNADIVDNRFYNNHSRNPYGVGGGQILIGDGTRDSNIHANTIKLTQSQQYKTTCGIEFATGIDGLISNVNVYSNYIHNNTNGAILFNPKLIEGGVAGVYIFDNSFYGNGLYNPTYKLNIGTGYQQDVNIYSNFYTLNLSASLKADFIGTPRICNLNGATVCNPVNIVWHSSGLISPRIIVDGNGMFSNGVASGNQAAPWVSQYGDVFELFDKNSSIVSSQEPIARHYIKGQ